MPSDDKIFVFGSNLSGVHGAGAAKHALQYGAQRGVGVGRTGQAYALPTKGIYPELPTLTLREVRRHVDDFLVYAADNPDLTFRVTAVGCGLAGFKAEQIAPLFAEAPENCLLPPEFLGQTALRLVPAERWWKYEDYQ